MEMLSEFPCLIVQDLNHLHYDGYINICKEIYRLEIKVPPSRRLSEATVNCDWRLHRILKDFKTVISQRLRQCENIVSFVKELQMIAERELEGVNENTPESSKFCQQLIGHIETLGWERLVFIDQSFTELHVQYIDNDRREHTMKLFIGNQYPVGTPKCSVELPSKFDLHWTTQSELKDAYKQFTAAVDSYREFWDVMSEIDSNTWVLEPEKPTYSARHRRIAISASVSVQLTVDPAHPRVLPECKFLGSDQAIAPVRRNMNANIHFWDERLGLLENLQTLLDVKFPSPTNSKKEEFSVECGICYAYRMDSEIPDEVCNDTRCGQAFHKTCVIEWLRALPSSRQSFNTIFGNCPYCEKAMTVKMIVK
ncbi:E3 ubiquitin-protein ligase FANCL-like [Ruditapes philippinarum]|uniref:E3 ubiquitin-protein ligase FANCL-like n=1 Tax=Ruditapes philippinarum TaxID=129788 RepID=UPI00295AC8C3|nr:E3 ubiquitin-protein ligase FANCL-like [Ruditapes philippinarum]